MALLGVDNDSVLHRLCRPPLSSIDHGAHQLGYRAAALLRDLLAGRPAPTAPILVSPIGVVSRQSTDTLAVGDPDVATALRLIRGEACDGLPAEAVVRRVNISRTSLETRFRTLLGRSVHQEIVRVRMEEAKHLLRVTDLAMPDITSRSGFRYPSQVSHLFRKHLGVSPREYRARMRTST
jgi:LacI family transcriptional regulator